MCQGKFLVMFYVTYTKPSNRGIFNVYKNRVRIFYLKIK
jgi:hypothetical protein